MRIVICGAGAIGGGIGALLHRAGTDVILVARGDHLTAIQERGLRLLEPGGSEVLSIPAVARVEDVDWDERDVAIVATKLQDSAALLNELARSAPDGLPVFCAQNGLAGERMAARRGFAAHGMLVWMPAAHLVPGEVRLHGRPVPGLLDVGTWPRGTDDLDRSVSERLTAAGFESECREDIMMWKRSKLLTNLAGMLRAVVDEPDRNLEEGLRSEARAVYDAAGLQAMDWPQLRQYTGHLEQVPADGVTREGSSAWQSLARGVSSEVDFLCGEIVLLGTEYGVPTPLNRAVQRATHQIVGTRSTARSLTSTELRALID